MRLSSILRQSDGPRLHWWCPGCGQPHCVQVGDGPGPRWGWNKDVDHPTFTPSVAVTWTDPDTKRVEEVCHSFVKKGAMQFLGDCTHELAGQTVPIPAWPSDWEGV